jgi:hypothetical protein
VAGAWAVLKSKAPSASVDQILTALVQTGVPVTDRRNGIAKARMQLDKAAAAVVDARVPYPTGSITDTAPTFRWQSVAGATWYYLLVQDNVGQAVIAGGLWANEAGCSTGTCSVTPSAVLARGSAYHWTVAAGNDFGYQWGAWHSFVIAH